VKVCKRCNLKKPLADYYRHPMMGDGHLNFCKECTKERVTRHRAANIKRIRKYDVERHQQPKRKRYSRQRVTEWRKQNPEKYRAHAAVAYALRTGKMRRRSCEVCRSKRTHAHHDDYSKPLAVLWLCAEHHSARHKMLNAKGCKPWNATFTARSQCAESRLALSLLSLPTSSTVSAKIINGLWTKIRSPIWW